MTLEEWLEGHADRASSVHNAVADTSKLVATFTSGVASALVASALQVEPHTTWDTAAAWLLGASVLMVIFVTLADRRAAVDVTEVLLRGRDWSDDQLLAELRVLTVAAVDNNATVANTIKIILAVQVTVAFLAGLAATISLLS